MPAAKDSSGKTPRKSVARATGVRADGSPRRPSYTDVTGRRGEVPRRAGGASASASSVDRRGTGRSTADRGAADRRVADRSAGDRGAADRTGADRGAPRGVAAARAAAARGTTARGTTARSTTARSTTAGRADAGREAAGRNDGGRNDGGRGGSARTTGRDAARESARDTGRSTGRATSTVGGSAGTRAPRPTAAVPVRKARPASASPSIRKPRTAPTAASTVERDTALDVDTPGEVERLQKVLANAGIGSRRASEELIAAGRVTVDGKIAQLGDRADAVNSVIYVDGERIITDSRRIYLAMNKPAGVVSTMADEKGRAALADFLGNVPQRVYHVGRLDQDSEGLLLLTNDGSLAHKLMHPSYGVRKTYLAEVSGPVRSGIRRQLMEGVELEDGPIAVDGFRVVDTLGGRVLVEVVLHEGRKHIVRRLLAEVGHPVTRLVRTAIGPIKLGDLKMGRTRRLTRGEIAALFGAVED